MIICILIYITNEALKLDIFKKKVQLNGIKNIYTLKKKIKQLPDSIKKRIILTIIPQQIQIRLIKNNLIDEGIAFDLRILSICKKVKIKCISKSSQLAKKLKYETHFVLDGHLYPKASAEYGKMLGDELTKIIKNDK